MGRHAKVLDRNTIKKWVEEFRNTASAPNHKTGGSVIIVWTPENNEGVRAAIGRNPTDDQQAFRCCQRSWEDHFIGYVTLTYIGTPRKIKDCTRTARPWFWSFPDMATFLGQSVRCQLLNYFYGPACQVKRIRHVWRDYVTSYREFLEITVSCYQPCYFVLESVIKFLTASISLCEHLIGVIVKKQFRYNVTKYWQTLVFHCVLRWTTFRPNNMWWNWVSLKMMNERCPAL
jgi:hypothetical protein